MGIDAIGSTTQSYQPTPIDSSSAAKTGADTVTVDAIKPVMGNESMVKSENGTLITMIGAFRRVHLGISWWFCDHKRGMYETLEKLSELLHITSLVGMLTDSRSFLSYPRHHYFRRILCNYLGEMMEKKEMTNNIPFVGKVIEDISFNNAVQYFDIEI